jgi:hypothetical protein
LSDAGIAEPTGLAPTSLSSPARAKRRRRIIGSAAGVAALAIALVTALVVIVTRPHPFTAADARQAGVLVMVGQTLFLPNGRTESYPLGAGDEFGQLAEVPDGLLAVISHEEPDAAGSSTDLRLIYPGGSYEEIATSLDSEFQVTSDGRTVVIRSSDAHGNLALRSIDIATDRQLHAIGDGNQYVVALNGDWVLITNMGNGVDRQPSELWNARTGAVVPFATYLGVAAWGVTASGDVLRGIDIDASTPPDATADACYDLVAPIGAATSATLPTTPTGYCGSLNVTEGMMSPDGTWAVLLVDNKQTGGNDFLALRTADLHAGRWSPAVVIRVGAVSTPLFWDLTTSFIAPYADDTDHDGYERCSVDGQCHELGIPGTALIAGVYDG